MIGWVQSTHREIVVRHVGQMVPLPRQHCTILQLLAMAAHVVYENRLGYKLLVHAQHSVGIVITAGCSTVSMHHLVSDARPRLKAELHCMDGQMNVMTYSRMLAEGCVHQALSPLRA